MASNKGILVVALLAAVAGAAASLYFEPTIALRLAGTEPGQRVLETVLDAKAPTPPSMAATRCSSTSVVGFMMRV